MNRDEIKFLALQELGFAEFPDFTSEEDNAVNIVNNQYDHIYSLALQSFSWSFTERMVELTDVVNDSGVYQHKCRLPNDILYLRGVYSDEKETVLSDYKLAGDYIYTNDETVYVSYTRQVCEEELPAYFIEYLKYRLARNLCPNITGDKDLLQWLTNNEQIAFANAKNIDLTQRRVRVLPTGAFVDVRF